MVVLAFFYSEKYVLSTALGDPVRPFRIINESGDHPGCHRKDGLSGNIVSDHAAHRRGRLG
jgi:hypothetical protein